MKLLVVCLICLSGACFGQIAPVARLSTGSGFLEVCGRSDTAPSKEQLDTVKNASPSEAMDKIKQAMADRTAEVAMCFAFLSGLEQGWKEGHEHGVVAAQFPAGWPNDEEKALAALPAKQLQAAHTAMSVDVPCIPEYVTLSQKRDIVAKYIKKNPLLGVAFTSRVVWVAFQEAFPCPSQPAKPTDAGKNSQ